MTATAYILSIFFSLFLILVPSVSAKEGSLEVSPAYLEITLQDPEQEITFPVTFKNNSTKSVSLDISPIDFKQQSERGGVSFLGQNGGSYSYSLSSFLTFETNHLQIEPGSAETLKVTVKNRQDLSPGGHYAAVVAKLVMEGQQENIVSPAVSSLIFMRKIGGERFNLSIKSIDWPNAPIVLSIPKQTELVMQNEGNIHAVPYGRVEIKDMFGRLIYKGILNSSSAIVMPESRRLIFVQFTKLDFVLPLSFNSMSINGSDSLRKTQYTYQGSFIYINPYLFVILPVALVGFLLIRRKKKRIKHD